MFIMYTYIKHIPIYIIQDMSLCIICNNYIYYAVTKYYKLVG